MVGPKSKVLFLQNFKLEISKKQNSTQHMFLISSEEIFRVKNNIPQGW